MTRNTAKHQPSGGSNPPVHRTSTAAEPASVWRPVFVAGCLLLLALLAGAVLSFHTLYEPDLGWHLSQGREVAAGRMVRTNLFSSTYPNYPQPFQSWLFELGAYGIWNLAGATGIQAGQALTLALTLAFVYAACRKRVPMAAALAVAVFGVFVIEPRAVPRPHVVSFALGAGCAFLVERARALRSPLALAWTIPLIAVWSNVHAESFFGAALVGLFAASEFLRPGVFTRRQAWTALGVAVAATAANAANPFGLGLFRYIFEGARAPEFVQIAELRPAYLPTYAPFFVYLACGIALMLWKRRSVALWEVLVFGAFAILGLRHVRFVALFLCVTAPIVAARLAEVFGRIKPVIPFCAALCAGLLLSPVPFSARIGQLGIGEEHLEPPAFFSREAISFIRANGLKGPVFNSNNLGGYLIWNTYPDGVRVFQDGRFQSYPPEHFARIIEAFRSQSEWDKLVADVDWAVLSMQRSSPLSGAGRFPAAQWAPVYRDPAVMILVRRTGRFGALAGGR